MYACLTLSDPHPTQRVRESHKYLIYANLTAYCEVTEVIVRGDAG